MKTKIRRSILVPAILLIYLIAMSLYALPDYLSGVHSAFFYFGVIITTLIVIILLHFSLKRRERLKKEREEEIGNRD